LKYPPKINSLFMHSTNRIYLKDYDSAKDKLNV